MKISTFIEAMVVATALISCEHQQELCLDHSDNERRPVEVIFDWSQCPDADPQSMSLYLFPSDGSHFTRHEFAGRKGGRILVMPGHYSAVAVNSDNNQIRISNDGIYSDFSITLRDAYETQGLSRGDNRLSEAPDPLWVTWCDDIVIDGGKLKIKMNDALCHYTIEIRRLDNANLVRSITATLTGMTSSLSSGGATYGVETVRLLFPVDNVEESRASGKFLTLGHCGLTRSRGNPQLHELGIYFTLGDGSVRLSSVDVTEQVHSQSTERCHILVDSLSVPLTPSGGMDLSVDDWDIIDIPISTN